MFRVTSSTELIGVRAKVDRAIDHFEDVKASIERVLGPKHDPKSVSHQYDPDRQELVITRPVTTPLEPALPLMVGDCIHNARSALDHLIYQLAIKNGAPAKAASKTFFPICLSPREFNEATRRKVAPFIGSKAFAEIEKLQPYATGNSGDKEIIWLLSKLDIIDKHRLLIVTESKFRPVSFSVTVPGGEFSRDIDSLDWKPSKDGAEIIRFDLSRAIKTPGKVNVKVRTATAVHVEQTGLCCDGMTIQAVLMDCVQYVADIVDSFGQMFFDEG